MPEEPEYRLPPPEELEEARLRAQQAREAYIAARKAGEGEVLSSDKFRDAIATETVYDPADDEDSPTGGS